MVKPVSFSLPADAPQGAQPVSFSLPAETQGPTADETARFAMDPVARGVRSAWAHTGAAAQAYAGQVAAASGQPQFAAARRNDAQNDLAEEQFWANPVQTWDQAQATGNYGDYVRNLIGQGLVSTAPALAGSMALRGIRGGALIGGTAGMFPQMAGDEVLQARANPHNANVSDADLLKEASAVGLGSAAAMAYLPTQMSGKLLGAGVRGGLRGLPSAAEHMLVTGAEGAGLTAGATKLSQLGQSSLDPARDTSGDPAALKEAAIGGGIGMLPFGAMGAAGELLHGNAKAAGTTALDLAKTGAAQAVDAGRDSLQTAREHAPAAAAAVGDAAQTVGEAAQTAGQAAVDYGLPKWDALKQYARDKGFDGMASDAVDRFKRMVSEHQTPVQEAWAAGTTVPDDIKAQGVQAIVNFNNQKAPQRLEAARLMADELTQAPQVPDDTKAAIAAMNGDYANPRHQQTVAQLYTSHQQGVDTGGRLDAVTRAIHQAVGPETSRRKNQQAGYQLNQQYDMVDHAINDALIKHLSPDHLDLPFAQRMAAAHAIRTYIEAHAQGKVEDLSGVARTLHHAMGDEAKPFMKMAHTIMQHAGLIEDDAGAATRDALTAANKHARGFQQRVKGIIGKYLNPALVPHVKTTDLAPLAARISRFFRGDGTHDLTPAAWHQHQMQFLGDMHALFGLHTDAAMREIYAEHDKLTGTMKKEAHTGHAEAGHTVTHEDDGDYRHMDYDNRPTENDAQVFHHNADRSRDNERLFPSVKNQNAAEYGYQDALTKKQEALAKQYPSDQIERISGRDWAHETGHNPNHIAAEIVREKPELADALHRLGAEEFLHQHTEALRRRAYTPHEHDLSDADLKAMRGNTQKLRDTQDGKITVLDRNGQPQAFSAHSIVSHMFARLGKRYTVKARDGFSDGMIGDLFAHGLASIMSDSRFGHDGRFFADTTARDLSERVNQQTGEIGLPHFPDDMLIYRRKDGTVVTYGDIRRFAEPELQAQMDTQNRVMAIEKAKPGTLAKADKAVKDMLEQAPIKKADGTLLEGEAAGDYRRRSLERIAQEDSDRGAVMKARLEKALHAEFDPWDAPHKAGDEPTAHNYEDTVDAPRVFDPNHGGLPVDTPLKYGARETTGQKNPVVENAAAHARQLEELPRTIERMQREAAEARDPKEAARLDKAVKDLRERLQDLRDNPPPTTTDAGLLERLEAADAMDQQRTADTHIEKAAQAHADADFGRHALGDDAYQYSKSSIGPTPMDKTTRTKVKDYLQRVLGDAVKVLIKKDLGHTGDFSVQDGVETIRLSSLAADPMQAAFHEAFHAFVKRLGETDGGKPLIDTLKKAAQGDFVQGQLKKLLKNEKDALKQLQDPHEAMAYMYQFWAARDARGEPMLALGPKADGLFARISQFFDKVRRILRGDPNANEILSYFHSGEFQTEHANGLSDATLHSIAAYTQAARDSGSVKGLKKATEGLYKIFATADARMRDMKIPEFTQMADLFQPALGAKHKDLGYLQAKMQKGDQYLSQLNRVFHGFNKEAAAAVLEKLQNNAADVKLNKEQKAAVRAVHALLDDLHGYLKDAGLDLNYVGTPDQRYFPRVWDTDYIMQHSDDFRAMLEDYERRGQLQPGATDGIMSRLLQTNGFDDITEGESRVGYAPGMAAANARVLRMIKPEDAARFQQKDLSVTLSTYIGQAVQRAEYTRRFGPRGQVLDELMKKAKGNGATAEQLDTAKKYIMAMEGTLGNDISMMNRKIQGGLMVYQNYRLLPLSLFSNLVDPFGVMVRGGTMREAFATLLRGFKEVGHEFGQGEPDALRQLAEDLGIIVDHSTMSSMGNMYNSQYFLGWQKKANDGLFKYNLMEGWNKSMRVGALKAAVGFVERHARAAGQKKPDATSLRYLSELNLKPADVQLDKKGRLTNLDDEKVQQALYRWVDEAIMRPNASQRPIYGSDPHYMAVFHLKQFTYTFYKQIMGRALHEAKHGNLAPAFTLLGYVPMMVAADAARGMVTGMLGGQVTQQQQDDSLWGTVEHGWERAGLNGPAQFAVDGVRAYQHGNLPFINMLGPSGEQAAELGEDMAHHDLSRSMRRAPPLAQLFNSDMVKNGDE